MCVFKVAVWQLFLPNCRLVKREVDSSHRVDWNKINGLTSINEQSTCTPVRVTKCVLTSSAALTLLQLSVS